MGRLLGVAIWSIGAGTILASTQLGWISGLLIGLMVAIGGYALLDLDTRADVNVTQS